MNFRYKFTYKNMINYNAYDVYNYYIMNNNQDFLEDFKIYLKCEKNFSSHTIRAYINDVYTFLLWLNNIDPLKLEGENLTMKAKIAEGVEAQFVFEKGKADLDKVYNDLIYGDEEGYDEDYEEE